MLPGLNVTLYVLEKDDKDSAGVEVFTITLGNVDPATGPSTFTVPCVVDVDTFGRHTVGTAVTLNAA